MDALSVLVVDDEPSILASLETLFGREGISAHLTGDPLEALEILRKQPVPVLLTDLAMPKMTGMELMRAAHTLAPGTEVIVMTAFGTVEAAVEAMKEGAYDFVTKPLRRAAIMRAIRKALEKQRLVEENRALRAELEASRRRPLIGSAPAWRATLEVVKQAAASDATVLLLGESGTGKELLARALHEDSPRAQRAFVPVSCSAIPEAILEAELFGYERGAFTGAVTSREGRFALAHGGTLFLDEIGELAPHVQVKLLRVLQEGEIERLGGATVKVDIRLVAATHRDLGRDVKEGRFREDLYYRLNVISVQLPPLRSRRDDIALLAEHFLVRFREKMQKPTLRFGPGVTEALSAYAWPGNVRELENAIERAVVLSKTNEIDRTLLPSEVGGTEPGRWALTFELGTPLEEVERRMISETLAFAKGDKRLAARLLGVATRTIYRKLPELGLEPAGQEAPLPSPGPTSGSANADILSLGDETGLKER